MFGWLCRAGRPTWRSWIYRRVTDKGGIELKFLDRVRALETLYTLLEGDGTQGSARELYQALTETSSTEEGGWEHG